MMLTPSEVLSKFKNVTGSGNKWAASCPLHDDSTPSLSITLNGEWVFYCHKCSKDKSQAERWQVVVAICKKVGINPNELFPDKYDKDVDAIFDSPKSGTKPIIYDYTDATGKTVLHQTLRYEPKRFLQRRPDGKGGWVWHLNCDKYCKCKIKLPPLQTVIYRLPEVLKATEVIIVEGEKDVETARALGLVATCNPMGAGARKWRDEYSQFLSGKHVTIIPDLDEDQTGQKHAQQVAASLAGKAPCKIVELPNPNKLPKWDLTKWVEAGRAAGKTNEQLRKDLLEIISAPSKGLRVVDVTEFVKVDLPERPTYLDPFLEQKSIGMIHAWRGVGKTHMGLGVGAAVASGGKFLKWNAPNPVPVLYVDGEMADKDIQDWLKIALGTEGVKKIQPGYFDLICADLQDCGIPSLLTPEGQHMIEDKIGDAKLIVFDNITSLFRGGSDKDDENWNAGHEWLLSLRRQGLTTVLDHHDGKGLTQRGTSKREDPMNWVIHLKHPGDYKMEQGLRAEVHFEKTRRKYDARPFEVQLTEKDGKPVWVMKEMVEALADTIRELQEEGLSFSEIGKKLNISRGYACKLAKGVSNVSSEETVEETPNSLFVN